MLLLPVWAVMLTRVIKIIHFENFLTLKTDFFVIYIFFCFLSITSSFFEKNHKFLHKGVEIKKSYKSKVVKQGRFVLTWIEIIGKFSWMKKLWRKNEILNWTFGKSSLYQLKYYLWLRNFKNQILLDKLAHKHVYWPNKFTIGWFVL